MKYYPICLDVRQRPCLVIGGGGVAERKALSLLEAGADVTVVSPSLTPKLADLAHTGKILHYARPFEEPDLAGMFLVVAATNSIEVNSYAGELCRHKGILVNVAAPPEAGSFVVPSVLERGDLLISVSTSGANPALAGVIRRDLDQRYGAEYEMLMDRLAAVRKRLHDKTADGQTRKRIMEAIIDSDVVDLLRQGKRHEADLRISELIDRVSRSLRP
jgi:precorrin-2 dehydrogenase/sirohydrochlorin ferrochelatase